MPTMAPQSSPHMIAALLLLVLELMVIQTRIFDFYLSGVWIPMVVLTFLLAFLALNARRKARTWAGGRRH